MRGFLAGYTSIVDVQNTVEKAKRGYEAKGQKRRTVLRWLSNLSLGIRYYSQALDMLAQHHPEYVALAWGAMKFVLTVRPMIWRGDIADEMMPGRYKS